MPIRTLMEISDCHHVINSNMMPRRSRSLEYDMATPLSKNVRQSEIEYHTSVRMMISSTRTPTSKNPHVKLSQIQCKAVHGPADTDQDLAPRTMPNPAKKCAAEEEHYICRVT